MNAQVGIRMFFGLMFVVVLAGCEELTSTEDNRDACSIVNYGQGVLYFSCTRDMFARTLAKWREENPCAISAVTGNGTGGAGYDQGYFIFLESTTCSLGSELGKR